MTPAIALLLLLAAAPAEAQATPDVEIHADVGVPGETDRFVVVTVRGPRIEGCITSASRVCTRTRAVRLDAAARAELGRLIAAIEAMPRCEPVGFAPGDPEFTLTIGTSGTTEPIRARGHLPRDRADVPSRVDEPCEAEHALAWWIVQRFGGR